MVQNEEQMIEKFGKTKWMSIRKNFKHNYWISQEHEVTYNDVETWKAEALLISNQSLVNAEYEFNALPGNHKIFEERFVFYDELPQKFIVEYDIVHFEKEMRKLGYTPKVEFELNI